jgi:26S proteasome regulatory subunit N3
MLLDLESSVSSKELRQVVKSTRSIRKFKNVISASHMKAIWDCFYPRESLAISWASLPSFKPEFAEVMEFPKSTLSRLQRCSEVDVYLRVLLAIFQYKNRLGTDFGGLIKTIADTNNHYLDGLQAVCFYFLAREKEKAGRFGEIRQDLLFQYSRACVRKDETGQAVLLTILLRNYLLARDYEAAYHLIDKSEFPENISNAEYCRYLYYDGLISAIRGDYLKAKTSLTQSFRKAPENSARGFKAGCLKAQVVVEMLLGEIPSREVFSNPLFSNELYPFYQLVQSVLRGRVSEFEAVVEEQKAFFQRDGLLLLIKRMNAVVIKVALKKINQSYSRISFHDIHEKLGIDLEDVEMVVAKAIRDQVISGSIDPAGRFLKVDQQTDLYTTADPQRAFARRIEFCMNIHHNAQRAIIHTADAPQEQPEEIEEDSSSLMGLIEFEDEI